MSLVASTVVGHSLRGMEGVTRSRTHLSMLIRCLA